MTTIAYHHKSKTIACDSRLTSNGQITNHNGIKYRLVNGVKFWFTGATADIDHFIDCYFGSDYEFGLRVTCFVYDDGLFIAQRDDESGEMWKEPVECNRAIGSGCDFAIAAMDFGCSAKDAVKYAATRDCYTGGKIRVFNL